MLLTGQPLHAFDLDRVAGGRLACATRARGRAARRRSTASERVLDPDMVLDLRRRRPDVDRRRDGRRALARSRADDDARAAGGRDLERPEHPPDLEEARRCAARRRGRFEKGLAPELAMEAQAVADAADGRAVPGAPVVPGTDRRRRRPAAGRRAADPAARRARRAAARERRSRASAVARSSSALGFGVTDADDGLDVTVPALPAQRRHARGRPDRGGRARSTASTSCPRRCRRRASAIGRLTPAQQLRRRAEDVLAGAGLHEAIAWSFIAPELLGPTAARRPTTRVGARSRSRTRCRPSTVGHAHDAAAGRCSTSRGATWRAGRDDVRDVRVRRGLSAAGPTRELPAERAPRRRPARGRGAPRVVARAGAAGGGLLRRQGRARRRCSDALRVRVGVVAADAPEPFLHPGRAARSSSAARAGRLPRRAPPARRARRGTSSGAVAAFELDLDAVIAAVPESPALRGLTPVPGGARRTSPSSCRRRSRGARSSPRCATPAASCSRTRGLRRLPRRAGRRGRGVARAAPRLPRARPHARPTRRSPSAARRSIALADSSERSGAATRDRCLEHRSRTSGRRPRRLRLRRRARGAARLDAIRSSSSRRVTARSRRGPAARRPLPAPPRAARARGARPRPARRRPGRRARRLPARRAAAPTVAALRERGRAGRRPVRRLPAARRWTSTSSWYGEHPAPELFERRRLRPHRAATATDRRTPTSSPTPAASRPRRCSALAPLARAGLIDDVVDRRQDRRLRRRPRGDRATRTSSPSTRTSSPTRSPATATRRRSTRSCGVLGSPRVPSPSCRT